MVSHSTEDRLVIISVDGSSYGLDSLNGAGIAVYSGTCGALVLEDSSMGFDIAAVFITLAAGDPPTTYYVRAACIAGQEGQFDIKLKYSN